MFPNSRISYLPLYAMWNVLYLDMQWKAKCEKQANGNVYNLLKRELLPGVAKRRQPLRSKGNNFCLDQILGTQNSIFLYEKALIVISMLFLIGKTICLGLILQWFLEHADNFKNAATASYNKLPNAWNLDSLGHCLSTIGWYMAHEISRHAWNLSIYTYI